MVVVGDEGFVFRGRGIWGWFHYGLWLCDLCPPDCFWKVWREVVHGHVEREREKERKSEGGFRIDGAMAGLLM